MIIRKLLAFIFTSVIVTSIFVTLHIIDQPSNSFWGWFWFIGFYSGLWILFYGIPVSIFSDRITKRFTNIRRSMAALITHLFFGIIITFILYLFQNTTFDEYWIQWGKLMFIASILSSFVLWMIDEILRKIADWERIQSSL
ncbi:hypothetical protein [Bacillus horti]|uniref:Uncharacterized membrane protein (DUF485 family) n=1 Tax=Caldalkalibacillus horti TaxID=77523 RepID=A0ABT9VZX0_9BACI|nr:hypothetical protein [Bacillus horti]MDQ0166529.1 uncharacterized membrane protein (DUF485 family) [Bacillus horti]